MRDRHCTATAPRPVPPRVCVSEANAGSWKRRSHGVLGHGASRRVPWSVTTRGNVENRLDCEKCGFQMCDGRPRPIHRGWDKGAARSRAAQSPERPLSEVSGVNRGDVAQRPRPGGGFQRLPGDVWVRNLRSRFQFKTASRTNPHRFSHRRPCDSTMTLLVCPTLRGGCRRDRV